MGVFPDHEIQRRSNLTEKELYVDGVAPMIEPFVYEQLQPATYDVLLGPEVLVPLRGSIHSLTPGTMVFGTDVNIIDLGEPIPDDLYQRVSVWEKGHVLMPGDFVLGSTAERVCIPHDVVGRIEGKSSIGRLGLTAHITAGFLDPGFRGVVTLEIANLFLRPIRIWPGRRIAQLSFETMSSPCERPYGSPGLSSRYQDAAGVEESRYGKMIP